MRRWVIVVGLAACGHHASSSGPAWPKQHDAADDGGESLAPRVARPIEVATPKVSDEPKAIPTTPLAVPTVAAPAPGLTSPTPALPPLAQPTEETITTEDLVIEIDD